MSVSVGLLSRRRSPHALDPRSLRSFEQRVKWVENASERIQKVIAKEQIQKDLTKDEQLSLKLYKMQLGDYVTYNRSFQAYLCCEKRLEGPQMDLTLYERYLPVKIRGHPHMNVVKTWKLWAVVAAALLCTVAPYVTVEAWKDTKMPFSASHYLINPQKVEAKLNSILQEQQSERQMRQLRPADSSVEPTQQSGIASKEPNGTMTKDFTTKTLPNHRFMAMVNTQDPCPTSQQWTQYTDIMLSYTTTLQPNGICSETCKIFYDKLKVCNNKPNDGLLQEWQSAGKRVWLVVGGPLMGRKYDLVSPACWEFCFGRQEQMVDDIATLVNNTSVAGVVLSYQYMLENNHDNSGFLRGNEAQTFLRGLTMGLREKLDNSMLLAHMPVDSSVVVGTEYFGLLSELAQERQFDLLMPQYFNGVVQANSNTPGALQHFDVLVTFMFLGDASRIVFGMCNNVADEFYCGGSDYALDSVEGASIMESLANVYSCHGGSFFWSASSDPGGFWSIPLLAEYKPGLEVEECMIQEEKKEEEKEEEKINMCLNPLTASSCSECIQNGCVWCSGEGGEPICQPKQSNTTACTVMCVPEEPTEGMVLSPDSHVQHHIRLKGLSQELYGITELPVESARSLEAMHSNYVVSFFSNKVDQALFLDSNITIVEVIYGSMFSRSLRRNNNPSNQRQLQKSGSSLVVVYDQEISYWYPVVQQWLSPETLIVVPFSTAFARDELTTVLQKSADPVLEQVLGVSEVIVAPQSPTESPVVPPITTSAPTTAVPSDVVTPPPTVLPQIAPTTNLLPSNPPAMVPTLSAQPVLAIDPTPSTGTAPTMPPIPVFNTNSPNLLPTVTILLTPKPSNAPPPVPTNNPTQRSTPAPIPSPTNDPPTGGGGGGENNNNSKNNNNSNAIFGQYTGFIVLAIVFGGLLIIFALYMKFCMGEYVDA